MSYVYLIRCGDTNYYKVGISENPNERLVCLQASNPHPLTVVALCLVGCKAEATRVEGETHRNLSKYHVQGEWFELPDDVVAQLTMDMAYASKA